MEPITIVKAVQTCIAAPCQWDAWDSDGNYWYLRFRGCRGTISKDYDVERAVKEFYDDSVDERSEGITLEDLCQSLGVRLDLGRQLNRIELAPERPKNFEIGQNRKIEIDAPRPGNVKLVIANGDKWASVEIEDWKIDFVSVTNALEEMERMIDADTD